MAISRKNRLGTANALISLLEPNGGFQPSNVVSGQRVAKSTNLTDEEANPEQFIQKSIDSTTTDLVISPAMLKALAQTDEISDLLQRLVSYIAIAPDLGSSFAYVDFLPGYSLPAEQQSKVIDDLQRHWLFIQDKLFSNSASLSLGISNLLSLWLTHGTLYIAIIREAQYQTVIDIHVQTVPLQEHKYGSDKSYWTTDNGDCQKIWEKEDIIVLDYSAINAYTVSFVASLMRTYNMFISVERTRVANAIMAAQFRSIYTVPTTGLGKIKARQKLSSVMALYKRDVRIDQHTGEVTVNGQNTYPVNTELWVSETSSGSVKIENPGDGNPQLNDTALVEYFMRKFYRHGKLPMSKYEAVDAGYLNGLADIDEDERQFKLFVQNCRSVVGKAFLKLIWRLIAVLPDYAGRDDLFNHLCMIWYNEPEHKSPSELLDGLSDIMDRINGMLDKYKTLLEKSGFNDRAVTARLNVLRVKLMRKYCPDLLEQTQEDYRAVPESESANDANEQDYNNDIDANDSMTSSDFDDWSDSQWDSEFSGPDTMGDDWSMPDYATDTDDSGFSDADWDEF